MNENERPSEWITMFCLNSTSASPEQLLEEIMADERCPAFGPAHHFIAGAVMLTCYRNQEGAPDRNRRLSDDLAKLEERSACVPGAACARWGVCGAAASVGMAYAIVEGNEPLKQKGWAEGQHMVARILELIARAGAPRCCKRDTRIAVTEATKTFNGFPGCHLRSMPKRPICRTMPDNTVCLGAGCSYHPGFAG
jgi:hypothetical protein